jgi:hypothetical protein
MRPLHSWPTWLLHVALRFGVMRGLLAEVWIELHARAAEEADAAARSACDETGPYLVAPPKGFH